MKTLLFFAIVLMSLGSTSAQVKVSKDYFVKLFEQGKYQQAFNEAYQLRKKATYGKSSFISYVMAKSLCLMGDSKNAEKGFKYILTEYEMDTRQKKFMQQEMAGCSKKTGTKTIVDRNMFVNFILNKQFVPRAGSIGKMGYVINCIAEPEAFKLDSTFDDSNAEKRIFDLDQAKSARAYYQDFLGKGYQVLPAGNFLIITKNANGLTAAAATAISKQLNDALIFFNSTFQLRKPDKLISVFLMNDKTALQQMAKRMHGINLSESNIGYSNLSDLTLLGISDQTNLGTLYHELFHLTVRADIGDIPGWLDEGMASLYETSQWQGKQLKGKVINWRTMVLQEYIKTGKALPALNELMDENWDGFFFNDTNTACDVSINYAVAKHFAIYLQEQDLLKPFLQAFKSRISVFTDTSAINQNAQQLISELTQQSIDQLQDDFAIWLNKTYKLPIGFDANTTQGKLYELNSLLYQYKIDDPDKASILSKQINELWEKIIRLDRTRPPSKAFSFQVTDIIGNAEKQLLPYMPKSLFRIPGTSNIGP